jgi:hypothetical protein
MSRNSSRESGTGKKEGRNIRANSSAALKLSFAIGAPSRTIEQEEGAETGSTAETYTKLQYVRIKQ